MKLHVRLTAFLALLLIALLLALLTFGWVQRRSTRRLLADVSQEKTRLVDRILALSRAPIQQFTTDYSLWDDMCRFVEKPDPAWAAINIDSSLTNWRFQAAWVLGPEGASRYAHNTLSLPDLATLPFPAGTMAERLRANPFPHFFMPSAAGPIEIFGAPIQPSADDARQSPPQGWFLVGRLWNPPLVLQLGELTECTTRLRRPGDDSTHPEPDTTFVLFRPLQDWAGREFQILEFHHHSRILRSTRIDDANELAVFALGGCLLLLVLAWALRHWITRPLALITRSMETDRPETAAPLLLRSDEFAHIARLVQETEAQKSALRREVAKSAQTEAALTQTLAERTRLGRDLHDGAIQSIYATGLNLQGIGPLLPANPTEAQRRLEGCVQSLNTIIAELRGFIARTTPAAGQKGGFQHAIAQLLDTLRPIRQVHCTPQIDAGLAESLTPEELEQLVMICREALSNILRHSRGTRVELLLDNAGSQPVLVIADNGEGFTTGAGAGRGIENMTRRAEEIGAALEIESQPGRGTVLRIELRRRPAAGLRPP